MGRHEEVEFSWAALYRADGSTDAFMERHGILRSLEEDNYDG